MTDRPKILYLAPVEPWCRENGSSLITADLLDGLSRVETVELFTVFVRRPPPGYDRRPAEGIDGVLLDIPGLPRWMSMLKAAALFSSPLRHRFDNGRVAGRIGKILRERRLKPDLVHVEHLPLVDIGSTLARETGAPLAYRAHNVESRLWARRLGRPSSLKRRVIAHMEQKEADAVRIADLTLLISPGDLQWARDLAPEAWSELLPCTLLLERYDTVPRGEPFFQRQMCFVGGLDWAPNEDGLRWFVQEVLPRVTQSMPEAGLAVLARGADGRPWLRDNPAVRILPAQGSAPELFSSSHVSIAPLFQGGGVRIKIPESLAVGCPVVATGIGAEGHEMPGLTRTDDPGEFASACLRALRDSQRERSRQAMREALEFDYGADEQARRLAELWTEAIRRHS